MSLGVAPSADNPLPRMPLYRHVNLSQNPGSEYEDRQYQFDITAVSLCTGQSTFDLLHFKNVDKTSGYPSRSISIQCNSFSVCSYKLVWLYKDKHKFEFIEFYIQQVHLINILCSCVKS